MPIGDQLSVASNREQEDDRETQAPVQAAAGFSASVRL